MIAITVLLPIFRQYKGKSFLYAYFPLQQIYMPCLEIRPTLQQHHKLVLAHSEIFARVLIFHVFLLFKIDFIGDPPEHIYHFHGTGH